MTDTTLNAFVASGTNADRVAFTPTPPTPASGPNPGYFFFETDTNDTYAWDSTVPGWVKVNSGGAGTVTSVATGTGLTGGPITGTGTVSLASIADGDLLANISGGSAAPIANTLSDILDHDLSSTQNEIPIRGASTWGTFTRGPVVSTQAGTTYSLALTDAWGYIRFTAATAVTVTVTKQATVAWLANTTVAIEQAGAGTVSIAADTGVTINKVSTTANIAGQYGVAQLMRTGSDTWTLFGALS